MGQYTIRLKGYNTDQNGSMEGALDNANQDIGGGLAGTGNVIASRHGYKICRPDVYTAGFSDITAIGTALSAFYMYGIDNIQRWLVTSTTNIYDKHGSGAYTAVGRATAYSTASFAHPWLMTQFGNITFAAQKNNTLQQSTAVGTLQPAAFSDVTGGPQARFVENVGQFLFVANTSTSSSQWICSALGNPQDWIPSTTTQCATGEVTSVPGEITGLKRLGDNIVIYKENGIFMGRYVGASNNTWAFEQIPGSIGAVSHRSIVDIGYAHLFVGKDDFYIFDGTRPIPLEAPVREHLEYTQDFAITEAWTLAPGITGLIDSKWKTVFWLFPTGPGISVPGLSFKYEGKPFQEAWGTIANTALACGLIGTRSPAYYGKDLTYRTIVQGSGSATVTATGAFNIVGIGDPAKYRVLKDVIPNWFIAPDSAVGQVNIRHDTTTAVGTVTSSTTLVGNLSNPSSPRKLEVLQAGRYFDFYLSVKNLGTELPELRDITLEFEDDGTE